MDRPTERKARFAPPEQVHSEHLRYVKKPRFGFMESFDVILTRVGTMNRGQPQWCSILRDGCERQPVIEKVAPLPCIPSPRKDLRGEGTMRKVHGEELK